MLYDQVHKIIEKEFGIDRAGGSFRVELDGEKRLFNVPDAFAGAIVQVVKQGSQPAGRVAVSTA